MTVNSDEYTVVHTVVNQVLDLLAKIPVVHSYNTSQPVPQSPFRNVNEKDTYLIYKRKATTQFKELALQAQMQLSAIYALETGDIPSNAEQLTIVTGVYAAGITRCNQYVFECASVDLSNDTTATVVFIYEQDGIILKTYALERYTTGSASATVTFLPCNDKLLIALADKFGTPEYFVAMALLNGSVPDSKIEESFKALSVWSNDVVAMITERIREEQQLIKFNQEIGFSSALTFADLVELSHKLDLLLTER